MAASQEALFPSARCAPQPYDTSTSAQAVAAAHSGTSNGDYVGEGVMTQISQFDRRTVEDQAVAVAHARHFGLSGMAFYRDQIPSAYGKPTVSFDAQAAR